MANEDIDFGSVSDVNEEESRPLTMDDFKGGSYLKNPAVDETISFEVIKIVDNKNIKMKNKTTGKDFEVGLKSDKQPTKRYDIHAKEGIYTITNWEIYFKLLGPKGLLKDYAKTHNNNFAGANITITRLLDGGHASMKIPDLAKVIGKTEAEATAYQEVIKKAIKEQRLYKIEVQ